jgi:hypothetical protein
MYYLRETITGHESFFTITSNNIIILLTYLKLKPCQVKLGYLLLLLVVVVYHRPLLFLVKRCS